MRKTGKFPEGADLERRGGPVAAEVTPTQPELTSLVAPGSGAQTPTLTDPQGQKVKAGPRNVISQVTVTGGESVTLPQIGAHVPRELRGGKKR